MPPEPGPDEAEGYRRELLVHSYRMLGSLDDAEDVVQEVMFRAWRRWETFEGRGSLRAWLYRIATNASLDALRRRARRPADEADPLEREETITGGREPPWLDPYPDELLAGLTEEPEARYSMLESVRLAFLRALQSLPPRQRAALILCDVLGYRPKEAADLLSLSLSSVNSLLHRARRAMGERYEPEEAEPAGPDLEPLLERYVRAWESSDVDGLVGLLQEEATLSMPPDPLLVRGRVAIGAFGREAIFAAGAYRLVRTSANGRPAFALYRGEPGEPYRLLGIQVVTPRDGRVADIVTFMNRDLARWFSLDPELRPTDLGGSDQATS